MNNDKLAAMLDAILGLVLVLYKLHPEKQKVRETFRSWQDAVNGECLFESEIDDKQIAAFEQARAHDIGNARRGSQMK